MSAKTLLITRAIQASASENGVVDGITGVIMNLDVYNDDAQRLKTDEELIASAVICVNNAKIADAGNENITGANIPFAINHSYFNTVIDLGFIDINGVLTNGQGIIIRDSAFGGTSEVQPAV